MAKNPKQSGNRPEPWFNDRNIVSVSKDRSDGGVDIYVRDSGDSKGYAHYRQTASGDMKTFHSGSQNEK